MIKKFRIFIWSIVAELEYILYPWKNENDLPPEDIIKKYNLPEQPFNVDCNYDWLKLHEDKIGKLQTEMIWVKDKINKLEKNG